jgi:DNA-binding response OmpR family regulator
MRHPRVIVFESDGRLAALLRPLAQPNGWALREPRRPEECLELVRQGGPAVVVLRIGRDLEQEFGLLDSLRWSQPSVAAVVVADAEHARLVPLAWDLGAAHVHLTASARENLPAVVAGLLGIAFIVEPE